MIEQNLILVILKFDEGNSRSEKRPLGLFNIYVTLKLSFSDPNITLDYGLSQDPPFIIYSSFLKLKKK